MRTSTIVVLGVAVLAGAVALYVWSGVTNLQRRMKRETTNAMMNAIDSAVASFRLKNGRLPATLQEIWGESLDVDEPPKDAWGRDIVFAPSADGSFELRSFGADGAPGGTDADADIVVVRLRPK